jgi:DNA mismatch repair protein MutL
VSSAGGDSSSGRGKVRRLSDALANQIAAGEVVERPASVVKELVENAVDAGATRVTVEIEQGGLARIAVVDDGEGLLPEDAELALERHATSKISRIEDLESLGSFGFRGEALPSIASVAKLTMTTRARGETEGYRLAIEGGRRVSHGPFGCAEGTRVDVVDLFYNVPARRKFLKAPATESAHVGEVVSDAALSRPTVGFRLLRDGKVARDYLRARTREERVAQVVSGEELRALGGERGPYKITAFLSAPERARSGATGLEILVNDRPVKDRALARVVAQAYGSVLEPGRYPIGVLYIDMPPDRVDVNVHPQKAEVRFHDARELQGAVIRCLNEALGRVFSVPALGLGRAREGAAAGFGKSGPSFGMPGLRPSAFEPRDSYEPLQSTPFPPRVAPQDAPRPSGDVVLREAEAPTPYAPIVAPSVREESVALAGALFPVRPSGPVEASLFASYEGGFYAKLRFLAQVRATFLLCEGQDALYVLDQHAAAERVTFHRLQTARASRTLASQRLLVPELVDVGERLAAMFAEPQVEAEVASLGFELRVSGERSVAVHAVPSLLRRARPEELVRDLSAELTRTAARPFGSRVDLVLATMACHASVRAGDILEPDEVRALLVGLDEVDFSGHCPHGRPVVTRLSFDELERRVGR